MNEILTNRRSLQFSAAARRYRYAYVVFLRFLASQEFRSVGLPLSIVSSPASLAQPLSPRKACRIVRTSTHCSLLSPSSSSHHIKFLDKRKERKEKNIRGNRAKFLRRLSPLPSSLSHTAQHKHAQKWPTAPCWMFTRSFASSSKKKGKKKESTRVHA